MAGQKSMRAEKAKKETILEPGEVRVGLLVLKEYNYPIWLPLVFYDLLKA